MRKEKNKKSDEEVVTPDQVSKILRCTLFHLILSYFFSFLFFSFHNVSVSHFLPFFFFNFFWGVNQRKEMLRKEVAKLFAEYEIRKRELEKKSAEARFG